MRDLSQLYYFEKLLEEVNNSLVQEGVKKGLHPIGSVCSLIPEPLLNLPGCFSVRLRAPRTGSIDIGTYYMSSLLCECCRAILERAVEGGYNFLDCIIAPDACAQMNRCVENIEQLNCIEKKNFFVSYCDVPMKADDSALKHYVTQMQAHVLAPLQKKLNVDIADASIRKAVEQHNHICQLFQELSEYRKEENPRITGYEFAVLCTASYCCPKELIIEKLEETAEELRTRQPDASPNFRVKVVVVGSEVDDPGLIGLIEEAGARVVADRFCFGALPGREQIVLNDTEDALMQVCRHYINMGKCPRYMNAEKVQERQDYVHRLVEEYHADGVIYQQMKFCDYWGYERPYASKTMREKWNVPVLSVDRPYVVGNSGQLRTRVQAFVESLEIKKLNHSVGTKDI